MFIYLGLVAAIVLSGPTEETRATQHGFTLRPAVIVDAPPSRRDIRLDSNGASAGT
jgi:hypothetical protein